MMIIQRFMRYIRPNGIEFIGTEMPVGRLFLRHIIGPCQHFINSICQTEIQCILRSVCQSFYRYFTAFYQIAFIHIVRRPRHFIQLDNKAQTQSLIGCVISRKDRF